MNKKKLKFIIYLSTCSLKSIERVIFKKLNLKFLKI